MAGVRATTTPVKLNVKTRSLPSLHVVFTTLLVSVDCCFFAILGVISGDFVILYSCYGMFHP